VEVPIPPAIREQVGELTTAVWTTSVPGSGKRRRSTASCGGPGRLRGPVRRTFERLDPLHRDALGESCDRALAAHAGEVPEAADLPDHPPALFARDVLDALDLARRLR